MLALLAIQSCATLWSGTDSSVDIKSLASDPSEHGFVTCVCPMGDTNISILSRFHPLPPSETSSDRPMSLVSFPLGSTQSPTNLAFSSFVFANSTQKPVNLSLSFVRPKVPLRFQSAHFICSSRKSRSELPSQLSSFTFFGKPHSDNRLSFSCASSKALPHQPFFAYFHPSSLPKPNCLPIKHFSC
jgi:hypothetical protein